jgi:hypothetical protein
MTRVRKVFIVALVVIGIFLLAYLLRNLPVPPDCRAEPEACKEP